MSVQLRRNLHYQEMCRLAREKRALHNVETASLNLIVIRGIYRAEGIHVDIRDIKGPHIRAAYFCDDGDCSVLVNKKLPRVPKIFSLVHELKHHYVDRDEIENGEIKCGDYNANRLIEVAAEVFAAEFIYPEAEMRTLAEEAGIMAKTLTPEAVVEFKHACPAPVSYTFLVKRFERFGACASGQFSKVQFQKLEEQMYGPPIYKQDWFKRYRARRALPH